MSEFEITAVCTVTDPQEQQRRWNQAFRVLLDLPLQKPGKEQEKTYKSGQLSAGDIPSSAGD